MKRFLGILVYFVRSLTLGCIIALSSCDDGDLTVENINFSDVSTQSCTANNLLFKLNNQESLILNIPSTTFTNNPTDPNNPISLDINTTNQVVYSFYDGPVATTNICSLIPPATPNINDQWMASSGKIQITTTEIKKLDETNNSTRITGYTNSIVFKNITFNKGNGTEQFYETFTFGDYLKTANPLPFAFNGLLNICNTNEVYGFSPSESLTLNIDPTLITNEVTPTNVPRTGIVGTTVNKLIYRLFTNGVVTADYFCKTPIPVLPTINQEWLGQTGGIIEVTTTTNGPNSFKHTIVLKNVTLVKGNSNFQLGNNYKYGDLLTVQ